MNPKKVAQCFFVNYTNPQNAVEVCDVLLPYSPTVVK